MAVTCHLFNSNSKSLSSKIKRKTKKTKVWTNIGFLLVWIGWQTHVIFCPFPPAVESRKFVFHCLPSHFPFSICFLQDFCTFCTRYSSCCLILSVCFFTFPSNFYEKQSLKCLIKCFPHVVFIFVAFTFGIQVSVFIWILFQFPLNFGLLAEKVF